MLNAAVRETLRDADDKIKEKAKVKAVAIAEADSAAFAAL